MKLKKIYIFTDAPMPVGFAPTNRILSYASGFEKNGVECEIIIFRKTENPNQIKNHKSISRIGKTGYKYLFKTPVKSKSFIKRRLDNAFGLLRLIFESLKLEQKAVIIYYSSYTRYIIVLKIISFFKKFCLVKEENEIPNVYLKSKNLFSNLVFNYLHYRLFDGYLLMTKHLISFFAAKYSPHKIAHIPMIVNLDRFESQEEKTEMQKVITYVGSLNNKKDGVLILLNSFSQIIKLYPNVKLQICGFARTKDDIFVLEKYVETLDIKDYVFLTYNVNSEIIPEILNQSTLLVLPRPDSLQAQNGFPTKLGEYLASGKPTVVTDVGEITKYLKDGISSYIAKAGDIDSLKNKLIQALNDPQKAKEIGRKGKEVAEIFFNNKTQAKKIIDFIKDSF